MTAWKLINNCIKRLFDIVSSGLLIIILIPLWIILAIAVKTDSKGPVFFKQRRRTKDGRVFNMLKFRSMIVDAEKMEQGLFTYENDPRVTKIGSFLRKTSLDELPQLFNIFIGDMSTVGPRPCVEYELGDFETINNLFKKRFEVKAGLTGLAQVKGRNDIGWNEKVKYDNQYVDAYMKNGVITDIGILVATIVKVFQKENIYENKKSGDISDAESARIANEEVIEMAHSTDAEKD